MLCASLQCYAGSRSFELARPSTPETIAQHNVNGLSDRAKKMTDFLNFSCEGPVIPPFDNGVSVYSASSDTTVASCHTVQHNRLRSLSASSLSSVGSYLLPSIRRQQGGIATPPRATSTTSLHVGKTRRPASDLDSRRASLASSVGARHRDGSTATSERSQLRVVNTAESIRGPSERPRSITRSEYCNGEEEVTLPLYRSPLLTEDDDSASIGEAESPLPFRKWVSRLRKKRNHQIPTVHTRAERWTLDDFASRPSSPRKSQRSMHVKSDSQGSSLGFVTAVRSATATLASASIATISRRATVWRRGQQRSSVKSERRQRQSVDSTRSFVDEAAKKRSMKRRQTIEELIRTEEEYYADIKALSNAYFTFLGDQHTSSSYARRSVQTTITDILKLHDDILGGLHRVVPFSEYDQATAKIPTVPRTHARRHSVDIVATRATPTRAVLSTIRQGRRSLNISRSSEEDQAMLRCAPKTVAAVTDVFAAYVDRFASYEQYQSNYDLVQRDIDETQRNIASWPEYDKGIENLSAHINPVRSREANRKKALTVKDLLIKPVQRLPRYALLFEQLANYTPVCDDPMAHAALEGFSAQLHGICHRMNEAKRSPAQVRSVEATWLVGDRLAFSSQISKSAFLQMLGHVTLCGCLHVAYRGKDRIKGCYVISILFESTLLLATADDDHPKYDILLGIALANATIEETDNQKGLQCHTAPHSWKLVFEHNARMYEVILTACTAQEAEAWRSNIASSIELHAQAVAERHVNIFALQSPMVSDMRSIGKAFGKPGSFVRRMSVHRTATVGPTTDLNQVIIKNTQSAKEFQDNDSQTSMQIPRSQSVQTPSHVQTLAPRRADRHRLEAMLADVWTKDVLPWPGMARRSDPIRAGANHVIRKFSMASITSNFSSSKRTPSYTSIASSRKEDVAPMPARNGRRDSRCSYSSKQPIVNFHNAPDAFLPADFELQDPKRKKNALRTFTLTMERPFSPLTSAENKPSSLRRAHSVRDGIEGLVSTCKSGVLKHDQEESMKEEPRYARDSAPSIYSVVQERSRTPASLQVRPDSAAKEHASSKTPRKPKSRMLLRFFGEK